ncbi:GAF domain-containing protein [Nocardioides flavescens]|uniref:GAF domain-containing protein n=1 Tax=Nocardioides flavescens TaxID=2691959 RepID=A0A6L7F107_9ACTN|nr:GAF domain-containing protein [Nocardioides flavescens]MXG89922.1 GAF domain-containing protein [Nocardioides flavescens]
MSTIAAEQLRLRSHDYRAPSAADVRRLLAATGDEVDSPWRAACEQLELDDSPDTLTLADLERVATTVGRGGGVVGLLARSTAIRIATYRELAARAEQAAAPPWDWARRALDELLRTRVPSRRRLQEIADLDPFSPEIRPDLDQVAARAAQRTGAATGAVNILLEGAQGTVGQHGMPQWILRAGGTPAEWSFCSTIRRTREPHVVPDAHADVLHRVNPLVFHEGTASYAGVPLVTPRGEVVGTCCVVDTQAREFTDADLAALAEEAATVVETLEERRSARARRGELSG